MRFTLFPFHRSFGPPLRPPYSPSAFVLLRSAQTISTLFARRSVPGAYRVLSAPCSRAPVDTQLHSFRSCPRGSAGFKRRRSLGDIISPRLIARIVNPPVGPRRRAKLPGTVAQKSRRTNRARGRLSWFADPRWLKDHFGALILPVRRGVRPLRRCRFPLKAVHASRHVVWRTWRMVPERLRFRGPRCRSFGLRKLGTSTSLILGS